MTKSPVHSFARPAHPRSRGEHGHQQEDFKGSSGSSPLARGTSRRLLFLEGARRLIPARAGNIRGSTQYQTGSPAHPRSRGEHLTWNPTSTPCGGSSPLARGTSEIVPIPAHAGRLIPARAGNIVPIHLRLTTMPAHPRSRGEHLLLLALAPLLAGSSPLARGT